MSGITMSDVEELFNSKTVRHFAIAAWNEGLNICLLRDDEIEYLDNIEYVNRRLQDIDAELFNANH